MRTIRRTTVPWKKAFPTVAEQKAYEGTRLIEQARDSIRDLISEAGLSHRKVAELLEVSESRVSQIIGGENYTLRSLAALGVRFGVRWTLVGEKIDTKEKVEINNE